MNRNSNTRLFFSNLPKFDDLIGYRAVHYPQKDIIGIQPPCCRELIFTIAEVLVSPSFDSKSNLLIVVEKSFGASQAFLSNLNKLRIKLSSKLEVDSELFQYCFTYTLYQKLAPFWNKTASFLVKGLEVSVTDKICVAVEAFLVKMPPVQVEDFMVDFESLWNFKRNPNYIIQGYSLEDCTCYVLPSLKRGRIDSITHSIPARAPFKIYDDIRQHWKVTYGYRLPADDCHLFFNVCFGGSSAFTYPEWCIRVNEPTRFLRCNQDEICTMFLQDVAKRMPNMCSFPLRFTKESLYWQKSLPLAVEGNKLFLTKQNENFQQRSLQSYSKNCQINNRVHNSTRGTPFAYIETNAVETENSSRHVQVVPKKPMPITVNNNYNNNTSFGYNHKIIKNSSNYTSATSHKMRHNQKSIKTGTGPNPTQVKPVSEKSIYRSSFDISISEKKVVSESKSLQIKKVVGKNIIDIPDSPYLEQMVPDELYLTEPDTLYLTESVVSVKEEIYVQKNCERANSEKPSINGIRISKDDTSNITEKIFQTSGGQTDILQIVPSIKYTKDGSSSSTLPKQEDTRDEAHSLELSNNVDFKVSHDATKVLTTSVDLIDVVNDIFETKNRGHYYQDRVQIVPVKDIHETKSTQEEIPKVTVKENNVDTPMSKSLDSMQSSNEKKKAAISRPLFTERMVPDSTVDITESTGSNTMSQLVTSPKKLIPCFKKKSSNALHPTKSIQISSSQKVIPRFGKKKNLVVVQVNSANSLKKENNNKAKPLFLMKNKVKHIPKELNTSTTLVTSSQVVTKNPAKELKRSLTATAITSSSLHNEDDIFLSAPSFSKKHRNNVSDSIPKAAIKCATPKHVSSTVYSQHTPKVIQENIKSKRISKISPSLMKTPSVGSTASSFNKSKQFCRTATPQLPGQALDLAMEILSQASNTGDISKALTEGKLNALLESPCNSIMKDVFSTPNVPAKKMVDIDSQPTMQSLNELFVMTLRQHRHPAFLTNDTSA